MYVRIVTFALADLSPEAYTAHAEQIADAFTCWPGLLTKVWLADPADNTYGGVYLFESRDAAQASRGTAVFAGLLDSPHFEDLSIREFDVLDGPTAVTAGRLQAGSELGALTDGALGVQFGRDGRAADDVRNDATCP